MVTQKTKIGLLVKIVVRKKRRSLNCLLLLSREIIKSFNLLITKRAYMTAPICPRFLMNKASEIASRK